MSRPGGWFVNLTSAYIVLNPYPDDIKLKKAELNIPPVLLEIGVMLETIKFPKAEKLDVMFKYF